MEAAIRWSGRNQRDATKRFLIADVTRNCIQYGEVEHVKNGDVSHRILYERDRLPNFTAFDWSREDTDLVALGTSFGEGRVININPERSSFEALTFSPRLQRKCNSIAFGRDKNLAIGLDRIRGDTSLNIYDFASLNVEPIRQLSGAEVITNVKFFSDQPETLVAGSGGVARLGQGLKLFDLRDQASAAAASVTTRNIHLISLDPLDENYLASAGPATENVLSVWDKRRFSEMETAASLGPASAATMEIGSVYALESQTSLWSLRYSGYVRGAFAVLSADGQIRYFETSKLSSHTQAEDRMFTKRSHTIVTKDKKDGDQIIGFDHASIARIGTPAALLAIRQSRRLWALNAPRQAPRGTIAASGVVSLTAQTSTFTCTIRKRSKALSLSHSSLDFEVNPCSHIAGEGSHLSSRERHHRFVNQTLDVSKASLPRALTQIDLERHRCLSGYLLDSETNIRIVKDDPWLVELWEIIKRLRQMASNQGMVQQGANLSYFGVYDLWFGSFANRTYRLRRPPPSHDEYVRIVKQILARNSYSEFEGVQTKYPVRRQLALAICDWKFDERRLREKCSNILSRREYYKAIVVAVAHGRKDIAIDILKTLTRTKAIENSALAAVVACSAMSDEQRELCDWMADEAEDPYLKALLAYFVSGSWRSVIQMTELPLQYRVAIALKYLEDEHLGSFLSEMMKDVVEAGDSEGVILTGLTESAIDLFQNYIAKFGDLQTAVLAMSFTAPHFINDGSRWEMWKTTYLDQCQAWSAFNERSRFVTRHNMLRAGLKTSSQTDPTTSEAEPKERRGVLCWRCRQPFIKPNDEQSVSDGVFHIERSKRQAALKGVACQRCGAPFPRCVICLHWQGTPALKIPVPSESAVERHFMAKVLGVCQVCEHGAHFHHAKEWFASHERCPVPGCGCRCMKTNEFARATVP